MEALAPFIFVGWILAFGIPFSLAVLAFSAYYRLKGIERAAWAIVTHLQAMRREERSVAEPVVARAGWEADRPVGKVFLSMFGR